MTLAACRRRTRRSAARKYSASRGCASCMGAPSIQLRVSAPRSKREDARDAVDAAPQRQARQARDVHAASGAARARAPRDARRRASRTTVSPTRVMVPKTSDFRGIGVQPPFRQAQMGLPPFTATRRAGRRRSSAGRWRWRRRQAQARWRRARCATRSACGGWVIAALPPRRLKKLPHSPRKRHGHHGHGPALENLLHALLELVHLAVARELAFGKDADDSRRRRARHRCGRRPSAAHRGSSRAGAIGMARAVRKMKPRTGILKML